VPVGASPDALLPQASAALRRVDDGDGVLVLTDLYGASPATSPQLARLGTPVRRVSALSLPMLLRVMNYPEQGLDNCPPPPRRAPVMERSSTMLERELTVATAWACMPAPPPSWCSCWPVPLQRDHGRRAARSTPRASWA
jgi:PTS system ascorbate-specific IIA component